MGVVFEGVEVLCPALSNVGGFADISFAVSVPEGVDPSDSHKLFGVFSEVGDFFDLAVGGGDEFALVWTDGIFYLCVGQGRKDGKKGFVLFGGVESVAGVVGQPFQWKNALADCHEWQEFIYGEIFARLWTDRIVKCFGIYADLFGDLGVIEWRQVDAGFECF